MNAQIADTRLSNKCQLKLDWCSHEAAKYAVLHWHYSKCLPTHKLIKIGVWENSSFIGCIVFGDGANHNLFKPYGLDYTEGCELVRVALKHDHITPVSRIIAIAFKFLRQHCPNIKIVISFADPEQGHYGGIYQASNWIYTGMTGSSDEYLICGVRKHGRALRSVRKSHRLGNISATNTLDWARKVLDPNAKIIEGSRKHRYLYALTKEVSARIEQLQKPYPKPASKSRTTLATS